MYAVVEFEKRDCFVVPLSWLTQNNQKCYWPTKNTTAMALSTMVKENTEPTSSWSTHIVRKILLITGNHDEAEQYLQKKIEETSSSDSATRTECLNITPKDLDNNSAPKKRSLPSLEAESDSEESEKEANNKTLTKHSKKKIYQSKNKDESSSEFSEEADDEDHSQPNQLSHPLTPSTSDSTARASTVTMCLSGTSSPSLSTSSTSKNCTEENQVWMGNKSILQKIANRLNHLMEVQDQNTKKIDDILRFQQAQSIQTMKKPENIPNLPISNKKDFKSIELFLREDNNFEYLKCRLACIGGANVRSTVMNMLKYLIDNKVAMKFNWAGRDKRPFKHTLMMAVLSEATRQSFSRDPANNLSDQTINTAVKDWLKLAKSRYLYFQNKQQSR